MTADMQAEDQTLLRTCSDCSRQVHPSLTRCRACEILFGPRVPGELLPTVDEPQSDT